MTFIPDVSHSLMSHGGNDKHDPTMQTYVASTLKGQRGKGGGGIGPEETLVADTLTSGSHPGSNMPGRRREDDRNIVSAFYPTGGTHGLHDYQDETPPLKVGSGIGIPAPPAIASDAHGVRRLTPVECERLQGLPDGWTSPGPDSRRYAGLGDAVTANVAEWLGRRLLEHERARSAA